MTTGMMLSDSRELSSDGRECWSDHTCTGVMEWSQRSWCDNIWCTVQWWSLYSTSMSNLALSTIISVPSISTLVHPGALFTITPIPSMNILYGHHSCSQHSLSALSISTLHHHSSIQKVLTPLWVTSTIYHYQHSLSSSQLLELALWYIFDHSRAHYHHSSPLISTLVHLWSLQDSNQLTTTTPVPSSALWNIFDQSSASRYHHASIIV